MIYTISDLISYARSRDERLSDTDVYTTAKMELLIEEALAVAQDIRPIFSAHETYNLYDSVEVDLLSEMEIILTKEPQSVLAVTDYDKAAFTIEITANNHVIVRRIANSSRPETYGVTIKYFFYPLMPIVSMELGVDGYRLIKETIGAVMCAELRDYEQEAYHKAKAKALAVESAYDLEKGTMDFPDTRLGDGTWV